MNRLLISQRLQLALQLPDTHRHAGSQLSNSELLIRVMLIHHNFQAIKESALWLTQARSWITTGM